MITLDTLGTEGEVFHKPTATNSYYCCLIFQVLTDSEVQQFLKKGEMKVLGHKLTLDDVFISYRFDEGSVDKERYEVQGSQEVRPF